MSAKAREEAAKTGDLPHYFLLRITRGEKIDGESPSLTQRIDAAKACAPYFAPRLSAVEFTPDESWRNRDPSELTDAQLVERILENSRQLPREELADSLERIGLTLRGKAKGAE